MKEWKEGKKSKRLLIKRYQEIIKLRKEHEALETETKKCGAQEITKERARDRMREIVKDQQQAMAYINSAINRWGALNDATNSGAINPNDLKYIF